MVEYLSAVVMFVLGYILGTWTFCRASRQSYVVRPGVSNVAPAHDPQVIQRSEADEALLETLRADESRRKLDGIGRF